MKERNFIVATAGHVDHGKSSLVKCLTGTDPDRLPEEKSRGITIVLGFAHLILPDPQNAENSLRVGIIDVPGHEDFVRNMIAGIGSIDMAILIVAADDGWMPQTEEHLHILTYAGVKNGIVVLTKTDLLGPAELNEARRRIQKQIEGTLFEASPILDFSALSGEGLPQIKSALTNSLSRLGDHPDICKPRIPVDRTFTLRGIGLVGTGTLTGGLLKMGQQVMIQPGSRPARVRQIQSYHREVPEVLPGSRAAVNLSDIDPADVHRGDVITAPSVGQNSSVFDVFLERSPREISAKQSRRLFKSNVTVKMYLGTMHSPGRVEFFDRKELSAGQSAMARIRLERPMHSLLGDRFIIRDWGEQMTIAGGIILDAASGIERTRQLPFLEKLLGALHNSKQFLMSFLQRDRSVHLPSIIQGGPFSREFVERDANELVLNGDCLLFAEFLVVKSDWEGLKEKSLELLKLFHNQAPEKQGMPVAEFKQVTESMLPNLKLFDAFFNSLLKESIRQKGTQVSLCSHQQALPIHLVKAGERIRETLSKQPFDPPARKNIAPDSLSQQALRFLIETRQIVDLSPEIVISTVAMHKAGESLQKFLATHGKATVSELKQVLPASRRVLIPLLEYFDKQGVTQRQGDYRVLRQKV